MKRTLISITAAMLIGGSLTGCVEGNLNTTSLSALQDAAKAATLTEGDAKAMAAQAAEQMDSQNTVLPASSKYSKRLNHLVAKFRNEDGLALNFKVYDSKEINAFAMSDGTIRVYRGLLDNFSDDEVRFVIGHEIGHVKLGHSLNAMRTAYATSAVRKGVASQGGQAGQLSSSQLGALGEALINAQFSQSQERNSDTYAVSFMKKHGFNPRAGLSVMKKFQQMDGGKGSMLSSHPASTAREDHIASLL
ncbi:MAG: M48 family metallopeptidase [Oceanospirillales bacterium]|uniref:Putative metalloprotease n=1 Tax=Marinobacterium halophilum TaxID=267374 RepID=A0A2P8F3C9_9GAMM|nr:M48 family metallopeptidase [Marinobacterium halophilum]MBR9830126.1 M48 family metallopeptidase [Oceanospirillales bacterium]PSL16234.1 putative metalloprotease [Marinobacterium halophilum]